MEIEQVKPRKPNFGLVVGIAAVVMLAIFVLAYFTLDWDGKRLVPHHAATHATSRVEWPGLKPAEGVVDSAA